MGEHHSFKYGLYYLLIVVVFYAASVAHSYADTIEVFTKPPTPEQLADILFKPRYRSIDGNQVKAPNKFGMMINFEFNSTKILPESLPLLDSLGEMLTLEAVKNQAIIVEGHTDAVGGEQYNIKLSKKRALAIKKYLVSSFNVSESRLITTGKGKSQLYDTSDPFNSLNRRAVFKPLKNITFN